MTESNDGETSSSPKGNPGLFGRLRRRKAGVSLGAGVVAFFLPVLPSLALSGAALALAVQIMRKDAPVPEDPKNKVALAASIVAGSAIILNLFLLAVWVF